ncbi:MAG: hypothetical protein BRD21_02795 [Halobacteriales archaeon SW_8_66_22]|jgi:hypothetical protein|nr:MAG: hypothetical protein BRD21_02795 [Halobacteriales archaeon SW_8_66_22]
MADDHEDDRPEYDPSEPAPPTEAPPLRSTAPQSEFTTGHVAVGFLIMLVGLAITFGLPLVAA